MKYPIYSLLFVLFIFASCDSKENKKLPSQNFENILEKSFLRRDNQNLLSGLEKLVNPKTGVYVIYKPGAIPNIKNYKSIGVINEEHSSIGHALRSVNCQIQKGNFPKFDFNKEEFSTDGCFQKDLSDCEIISNTQMEVEVALGIEFSAKEIATALAIDKTITKLFLISDAGLELYFAYSDGKYYLVLIDAAKYDLSA